MSKMFTWMKQSQLSLLLALIVAVGLLVGGCGGGGSDSYSEPVVLSNPAIEGHATNSLITPTILKNWIDAGYVNAENSFDGKVVIIDYASNPGSLRIPGAITVTAGELNATRLEGIAETGTMVPTGAMIDNVVQRLGIDENTTIVFTTGSSFFQTTRAHFIFRYWGFPRENLKVLNGGNAAWGAAVTTNNWGTEYELTDVALDPTPSTFSVRNLGTLRNDLRYSIGEMITEVVPALQSGTMLHLDALGPAHAAGSATNLTTDLIDTSKWVVFEGRIEGSQPLSQASLQEAGGYKDVGSIRSLFEAAGWTDGLPTTTACRAGVSCTILFFALEEILGSPAYVYDGSWGQWGMYSNNIANGGLIPASLDALRSQWATDQYTISGSLATPDAAPVYNLGFTKVVGTPAADKVLEIDDISKLLLNTSALYNTSGPADPRTNQIELEDYEYMMTPPSAGPVDSVTGGGGGGC